QRSFALPDLEPPELVSLSPPDGASGVSLLTRIVASFTEPLLAETVVSDNVRLVRVSDELSVPVNVELGGEGDVVTLIPQDPLDVLTDYRVELDAGLTDAAGNPLQEPITATFTTSDFSILTPPEGTPFVEGTALQLTVGGDDLGPVEVVRYMVDDVVLGT
ncbi:MAG: Ig-like domain-containing protein, partial [Akkermansiaceae bacterium]|nr:Ig-like domain-containing protein [Akkermansiaceae bacterium]